MDMMTDKTGMTRRTVLKALGAAGASIALAAPAIAQQNGLRTVRILSLPIAGWSGVHLAESEGFFAKEGLKAEFVSARTPADGMAMLMGGQLDVTGINVGGLASAAVHNLPLKVVAAGYQGSTDYSVCVRKDSPIKTVKDLSGKTIALPQLHNNVHALILDTFEREGGQASGLQFSLVPVAETLSSLMAGNVEAALIVEPFLTRGRDGIRPIIPDIFGFSGGQGILGYWVSTAQYKADNPELVASVKRAIDAGSDYAAKTPDAVRQTTAKMVDIDPAVLQRMTLPLFNPDMALENAEAQIEIMTKYGFFPSKPDLKPYFS
jgi:NitT/TauT family transport system substrate-binding protein